MTQILLIESNEVLRKVLKLNLKNIFGCEIIEKESAKDAISLIQILPDLDLIISPEVIGAEKTALLVSSFLEKEIRSTPLLILGNIISKYPHQHAIAAASPWKEILSAAGKILKKNAGDEPQTAAREFVAIGIYYFLNLSNVALNCDVYIRVKQQENDYQYIKRLHAGDQFTREDILKYKESGLKEFYIPEKSYSEFVNLVTGELVKQLGRAKLAGPERITLASEAYEVTLDKIHSIGIDDHTIALVEESIYSMESSLREVNSLGNFLKSLKENKLSYAYAHAHLCCLILHKVVSGFEWESQQIKDKLTYVAYFHDISLANSSLMKINSLDDLEKSDLSEIEKKLVNEHAQNSASIISKFPKAPSGVETIIREHHASKSGVGFPEELSIAITQVSMMFVVVEHFVDEFLKIEGGATEADFARIFAILEKRYKKATYLQTVTALQKVIRNKKG